MKTQKLFLSAIVFSTLSFAQKSDEIKIISKDKESKKTETVVKKEQILHFIQFGIMPKSHNSFKNKYGVDVIYENCVISPFISKQAEENNKFVAKILTEKYGDVWKKDLEIIPYGL